MKVSIVLNDMDRTLFAGYGFRSWLLQDMNESYEVIINLFNDQKSYFDNLTVGANPHANIKICVYDRPAYFNISAANNLGINSAEGKYILFANSDILYPKSFLRTFIGEIDSRGISYSLAGRVNLSKDETDILLPADQYTIENGFNSLIGLEYSGGRSVGMSLWLVLKKVAEDIGGFDPNILCHEDSEFNDRVMHYLRRTNKQACLYAATDLYGYHMHHSPSELYDASVYSRTILEPRRMRLNDDPESTEDVMSVILSNLDSLKLVMKSTPTPPRQIRKSVFFKNIKSKLRALFN